VDLVIDVDPVAVQLGHGVLSLVAVGYLEVSVEAFLARSPSAGQQEPAGRSVSL
jgi:hypothetical protein